MKISLKAKLLLSFFILISLPAIILGYVSYNMTANSLQTTVEQQLRDNTKNIAEDIDTALNYVQGYLGIAIENKALARAVENNDLESKNESFKYLAGLKNNNSKLIESLILVDKQGKTILTDESMTSDADLSSRDYVQKALKGSTELSEVIISKFTGNPVVALAKPVELEGRIVGVLVATINFDNISQYASDIKIGQNGYAYMIDKKGFFVYHPVKEKILQENLGNTDNTELKKLVEEMKAGETAEGFYTYEGVYKFVRFQPASNWVVAIVANYDEYMAAATKIKKITFYISGLALLIALTLAYVFATRNIISPIKQLQKLMDKAGNGDLTVIAAIETKDEIEALAQSFNQMINNQSEIVGQVRNGAHELAASSEEMAASSEQVSSATQQIGASIQQVAKDTDVQNNSIIEVSKALVQLASLVQLAQNKAKAANDNSINTSTTAQYGRNKVKDTVQAMEIINQKTNDTAEVVQELNRLSTKIGEIIDTINAIAGQTNLLALNAAIEAARAGEHGRGFAVVAEEVRKLAEESNKGANEIVSLVNEMVMQTERAVQSIQYGKQAVENGVIVVNETDNSFAEIIKAVEETVKNIEEIVDITKDEVATSEQVVGLIDTVATITENTAANTEEVAAASEEQNAAVQTLAATAEETSAMANSLESLVRRFKIKESK